MKSPVSPPLAMDSLQAIERNRRGTDLQLDFGRVSQRAQSDRSIDYVSPRYVPNLQSAIDSAAASMARTSFSPVSHASSRATASPVDIAASGGALLILTVHIPLINAIKKLRFNDGASVGAARVVIDDALRNAGLLQDSSALALFRDKDDARTRLDESLPLSSYALPNMSALYYVVADTVPVPESEEAKRARHRAAVIAELIQTEADYVADLQLVVNRLLLPARDKRLNIGAELGDVFRNIEQLATLHARFLGDLRDATDVERVHDVFARHLPRWTEPLSQFIATTDSASAALRRLRDSSTAFEQLAADFERSDDTRRKGDVDSFLFKPVQRICKYPLLLREAEKCCEDKSPQAVAAHSAGELAAALTKHVNRTRNEAECATRFTALVPRLVDAPSDLQQPKRVLLRDQELTVVLKNKAANTRLVVLFNNLLMVAHIKADKYEVAEVFDLDGGCYVAEVDTEELRSGFAVVKFDQAATRAVVQCGNNAERDKWVSDIRRAQCALPRGSAASVVAGSTTQADDDDDAILVRTMDPAERRRTKASLLVNLLRDEREYLSWMRIGLRAVKAWQRYATLASLTPDSPQAITAATVFGNIVALTRAHMDLADALEKRIAAGDRHIDDLFDRNFYTGHLAYLTNYNTARKKVRDEEMMESEFFKVCDAGLREEEGVVLTFEQMITAPIDRLHAHARFIKATLACTDADSSVYARMYNTLAMITKALKEARKTVAADDDMTALLAVVNGLSGAEQVPLVRRGRRVQHESIVKFIVDGDVKHPVQRRMYVCNDCIIIVTGKDGKPVKKLANGTWQFIKMVDLRNVLIRDHHELSNSFELVTLGNDKRTSIIVQCDTLSQQKTLQGEISTNIKNLIKASLKK